MLRDREKVEEILRARRKNAERFFIPLGGYDVSTRARKEISNATGTLYNHLPIVKAIVEACREFPVYVGYSGVHHEVAAGTYDSNILRMHRLAQDSDFHFAKTYVHELVHLDQDRRGLFNETLTPPPPNMLGQYLMHTLMLEAAAYATEICCLYYLSRHSKLREKVEEVQDYFHDYIYESGDLETVIMIETAMKGRKVERFEDMKPVWGAFFQHFFHPDSAKVKHYINDSCNFYLSAMVHLREAGYHPDIHEWGSENILRAITTLPGWGPMVPDDALPFLMNQIYAATFQNQHTGVINHTHDIAQKLVGKAALPRLSP